MVKNAFFCRLRWDMNEQTPQHRLIPAALEAVCSACSISRAVQQNLEQIKAVTKDDQSPVTIADYAVQAIVSMVLHELLSEDDCRIVGEEDAQAFKFFFHHD